jgi:coproporphyrinogen III oxidase-like Fe-S oxidoreductase
MMQLMCNMELRDYAALLNSEESSDGRSSYLSDYARDGLLTVTPERVSVTPNGRYLLHHIWGNA